MTDTFTPERPWNTTLTDSRGSRWRFLYRGADSILIREHDGHPLERFARGNWSHQIDLGYYDPRPEITVAWLDARAAEWIADRDEDIRKGNL